VEVVDNPMDALMGQLGGGGLGESELNGFIDSLRSQYEGDAGEASGGSGDEGDGAEDEDEEEAGRGSGGRSRGSRRSR
jgi:hypothetical protein